VSEFHAEAPQATASEGFAQGPYVAARAGCELATLRTKGTRFTNEPLRSLLISMIMLLLMSRCMTVLPSLWHMA